MPTWGGSSSPSEQASRTQRTGVASDGDRSSFVTSPLRACSNSHSWSANRFIEKDRTDQEVQQELEHLRSENQELRGRRLGDVTYEATAPRRAEEKLQEKTRRTIRDPMLNGLTEHAREQQKQVENWSAELEKREKDLEAKEQNFQEKRDEELKRRKSLHDREILVLMENASKKEDIFKAQKEKIQALEDDNLRLREQQRAHQKARGLAQASQASTDDCAARLRQVMTRNDATTEELEQAIRGVQALLDEASKELATKQYREKRAAHERLHNSLSGYDPERIGRALEEARRAHVDAEDVQKGRDRLDFLRGMSEDDRSRIALNELKRTRKGEAYLYVKQDNVDRLRALLDSLEEGLWWQEWTDHSGRSLQLCAAQLRAENVSLYLTQLLAEGRRQLSPPVSAASSAATAPPSEQAQQFADLEASATVNHSGTCAGPVFTGQPHLASFLTRSIHAGEGEGDADHGAVTDPDGGSSATDFEGEPTREPTAVALAPEVEAAYKLKAFRAVVADDEETLRAIITTVPKETWEAWKNKGGQDLIEVAHERGKANSYAVLAKELNMLREQTRHTFEEREAVWVYEEDAVQPRQATVLEDTPAEVDTILVEFWDGYEPASRIERCRVMKSVA